MARVDLTEPYAIRMARRNVRESLMAHGEEVIALRMYHTDPDQGVQPRCPVCYDDAYEQGDTAYCTACYGTTFEGGVKVMSRTWAMLTTDNLNEDIRKRGVYQPFTHQVQMEWNPALVENDYFLRVKRWSMDHRPLELHAAYVVRAMQPEIVRTGNQLVQDGNDYVGQRGTCDQLDRSHVIYATWGRIISDSFPVDRLDGLNR